MSEQKWGGAAEALRERERAELLEKLPPEVREYGEKLLASCEQDFETWSYTVTIMAVLSAFRRKESLPEGQIIDILKAALEFYGLAMLTHSAKFWYETAKEVRADGISFEELLAGLVGSHNSGLAKVKVSSKRLALLLAEAKDAGL
jgi:hypothetical protein